VMNVWSAPLPYATAPLHLPKLYDLANMVATVVGVVFTAIYAWQAQAEAQRMEVALSATQAVLAREQRLSALGGLAAAAAHELGTPLATIQVVVKEMARSAVPGTQVAEDVDLLIQQAERCREILRRLSRSPDAADERHSRMGLSQMLDEVAEPHRDAGMIVNVEVNCAVGASILEVDRRAEVLHGLSAFVENAVDFAESAVEICAYYDARILSVTVRDDGPGFSPEVMAKLGEPYVTTRSQGEGSRSGHLGMGLGFFIAKTLLEQTGATVSAVNPDSGGARVSATWARGTIDGEAPPGHGEG
jgi:two-component system sensor histidine kinase RegB